MTLYHGTTRHYADDIIENGISLTLRHKRTDFGRGFYTTPSLESAKKWAERKSILETPAVVYFNFDEENAKSIMRIFAETNIEWAQFIVNN